VSTPVLWDEVEQTLRKKDAGRLVFEAKDVLARVEKMGDLFERVLRLKQKLPQLGGLSKVEEEAPAKEKAVGSAAQPVQHANTKKGRRAGTG